MDKKQSRLRRARKTRAKIRELEVPRLSVHRTGQHIYAQVIGPDGGTVLVSASTIQAVAPGISEALVATAMGLAAAIPALVAYNHFSRQARVMALEMENFSAEFLNIAERHFLV